MRKLTYFLAGGALLALVLVGGYFGALYYLNTQLHPALDELLARLPAGWTASYKTADVTSLLPRTVRLTGIELHHTVGATMDAKIAEIDLIDPSLDPSALASGTATDGADAQKPVSLAGDITIKDFVAHTGTDEFKIVAIHLTGVRRYHQSVSAASDNPEVAQLQAAFEQTAFDTLTIDHVSLAGSSGGEMGVDQLKIAGFDRGTLGGSLAIAGVKLDGAGPVKLTTSLDSLEIVHPNLQLVAGWRKATADTANLTSDTLLPVVDSVSLKGWSIAPGPGKGTMKLDTLRFDNVRVYPAAWLKAGGQATLDQAMDQLQHPPAQPGLAALLPLLRVEAAGLLSFGYSATMDGLDAHLELPNGTATSPVVYKIGHSQTTNYDRCRLESASLDKLETEVALPGVVATHVANSVDHAEAKGLDMRDACARLVAGTPLDASLLDGLALASLEYAGSVVKIDKLPQPITLSRIAVSNIAFSHGLMSSGDVTLAGFVVTKALMTEPRAIEAFDKLGLDKVTFGYNLVWRADPEQKTASLRDMTVKIDELGTLSMTAELAGIDKPETMAHTAALRGAVLHYIDASLANRLLTIATKQNGADPAAFKAQLATIIQARAPALLGPSPAVAAATSAVVAFLTDPHDLTVRVAPAQPLPFSTLDSFKTLPPPKIFETLNVQVSANQATK